MKTMKNDNMRKTRKNRKPPKQLSYVFTEEDYQSNDGFLTKVWGPILWNFLHITSFNYPVKPTHCQKVEYRKFILNLKNVLPCGKCRENLKENFKKLPLTMAHMKNRDTFSRYIYDLHEVVNIMLCKTSGLTYEEVRERYEHFRSRCTTTSKTVKKRQSHVGCAEPLYGKKSKCVIHFVPEEKKCETLEIDEQCLKSKEPHP
jgi:hypothetical protein